METLNSDDETLYIDSMFNLCCLHHKKMSTETVQLIDKGSVKTPRMVSDIQIISKLENIDYVKMPTIKTAIVDKDHKYGLYIGFIRFVI